MSYTAGTLELSIFNTSSGEIANIDKMAKYLSSLSRAIKSVSEASKLSNEDFSRVGKNLSKLFSTISKLTSSLDVKGLSSLANASKSLVAISKLGNLADIDFEKVGQGFSRLTQEITPFINKVKEAETSLNSLYGILQKTGGKKAQKFSGGFGFGGLGSAVKLTSTIYLARRLGRFVGDIAQSGADYAETLNLWEVSMGKNIDQATKFVNKLNEAYGVSKETLMNSQAIFKNMLGTLGDISDQQAYIISEGVTQMALDYSSLFNVTFEQAMTKFEAALAGQVRPIRTVSGFDITENTLYQLYQSLGGTKTQRQLSLTEKRLLAILAIFNQMGASGAIGDLEKTMLSFANQSRVLAESWKQLKAMIGSVITVIVSNSEIIIKISGAMMALSRVFEALGESMGAFVHYQDPFGAVGDGAEGAETNVDKLNKSLKETENLLAIDKFRALTPTEDTTAQDISIDDVIAKGFAEEYKGLENIKNAATEVSKEILNMFGLLNEDGNIDMERLDELKDKFILISGAVIGVVTAIAALSTIAKISNASTNLKKMFSLGAPNKYLIIISLIVGALSYLYLTNEDVRESFNSLFESLKPLVGILFTILSDLLVPIGTILQGLAPLISGLIYLIDFLAIGINAVLVPITFVLEFVLTLINSILEGLGAITQWLSGDKSVKIGEAFGRSWKKMFSSEGSGVKSAISLVSSTEDFAIRNKMFGVTEADRYYSKSKAQSPLNDLNLFSNSINGTPQSSNAIKNDVNVYLDGEQIYHSVTNHAAQRGYQWEATR